jgi:hypothetical protein
MKSALNDVKSLRNRYLRNGKIVDAEVIDEFRDPPTLLQLDSDQTSVVNRCLALETDAAGDEGWIDLKSPSAFFVKMWMKQTPSNIGKRRLAIGRACVDVDCSAKSALGWTFLYCNRERMRISLEEGSPARIVSKETSDHDVVVATIKLMPFPLNRREFVARQVCASEENTNVLLLAVESVDGEVDYGASFRVVRGSIRAFYRFIPLSDTHCEIVVHQYIDVGGNVPVSVVNAKIPEALSGLAEIRNSFQRDEQIDEQERSKLALVIREEPQFYDPEEMEMIERSKFRLAAFKEEDFYILDSPDHLVEMKFDNKDEGGIGRAATVVDASIEECAAWNMSNLSREHTKRYRERNGINRSLTDTNQHCSIYHLVVDLQISGLQLREWVTRRVWKWDGDSKDRLEIFVENFEDSVNYPVNPKHVRAKAFAHFSYEKLEPIGEIPQTRVTYVQALDMGGIIPKRVASKGAVSQLMNLNAMRERFDKSAEIDAASRARIVAMINKHADAYSAEENKVIEDGLENFKMFEGQNAKDFDMRLRTVKAKLAYKTGDRIACGWASSVVRASKKGALAYIWDPDKRSSRRNDDLERSVDETPNDHNQLIYLKKKMKRPLRDREFLSRILWKVTENGDFVYVAREAESRRRQKLDGVVRATYSSTMKIARISAAESKIEYIVRVDAGGSLPDFVANMLMMRNLGRLSEMQKLFQSLRGLERWDTDDGKVIGELAVMKTTKDRVREMRTGKRKGNSESASRARVQGLFKKYKGLKEIGAKYEFMENMLARVVQNKLFFAGDVSTKLCDVSKKEGRTIGSGLSMSLASNLTAEAAVEEWIGKYPALGELDRAEIWFRPMMNIVAVRLLGEVSWGLKMRVFMGAGLSTLDLVSDINVIVLYLSNPEEAKYGWILLQMLVVCMSFHLLVVYLQYKTRPWRALREMLIVLTGLKPG